MKTHAPYFNQVRTDLSLDKDAPDCHYARSVGNSAALPVLNGLHHRYVRIQDFGRRKGLRDLVQLELRCAE